jgi:hypothetical protein
MAVEQWHPYLHSDEFFIRTDQRKLVHLDDQRLSTVWQQKAFTNCSAYVTKFLTNRGLPTALLMLSLVVSILTSN